jgi:hypothetical protein
MNVVGEILTKLFAIGIAGAGAFVAATYILRTSRPISATVMVAAVAG